MVCVGLQTRVVEQYLREEHLADFVADFLDVLGVKHEEVRLVENVLRQVLPYLFWLRTAC